MICLGLVDLFGGFEGDFPVLPLPLYSSIEDPDVSLARKHFMSPRRAPKVPWGLNGQQADDFGFGVAGEGNGRIFVFGGRFGCTCYTLNQISKICFLISEIFH